MSELQLVNIPRGNKILINLLIASAFLDGMLIRFSAFDFYYYYIILFIGVIICFYKYGKEAFGPRLFIRYFLVLFAISIFTGLLFDTVGALMFKQIAGICFTGFAYWGIFLLSKGNINYVGRTYMNLAFLEALYGVVGQLFFVLGLGSMGQYSRNGNFLGLPKILRTTSEPYFYALSLVPAVYVYLNNFVGSKSSSGLIYSYFKGIITIAAFILSGASSGYLALFIMLVLFAYNKNLLNLQSLSLFLLPALLYFSFFLFNLLSTKSKGFSERVNHTFYAFVSDEDESDKARKINGSSFALYSNYKIAMNSFKANPISGSGLGTHQLNYEKYFYKTFSAESVRRFVFELNKQDANSTFLRLLSETGLIGLLSFLFFTVRNLSLQKNFSELTGSASFLILLNQGIFVMLLIRLMRTGNYIGNGFFFFFFCYWAIQKFLKQQTFSVKADNRPSPISNFQAEVPVI